MTVATRERPILFSGPMVRAILEGRKTQTRRVVKPQPFEYDGAFQWKGRLYGAVWDGEGPFEAQCPYGVPGDVLLVKESHRWLKPDKDGLIVRFEADGDEQAWWFDEMPGQIVDTVRAYTRWGSLRPGRFLHNLFVRIRPEVTDVRVERVQDISEEDALAEGLPTHVAEHTYRKCYRNEVERGRHRIGLFQELWDSINAKRGFGWSVNPWVWGVAFQRTDASAPSARPSRPLRSTGSA